MVFFYLRRFCNKNQINLKIFSLSRKDKVKRFIPDVQDNELLHIPDASKANIETFRIIARNLHVHPGNVIVVEDDPFILRSAAIAGMNTVMIMNRVFTEKDYNLYARFIHFRIKSLNGLMRIIKQISTHSRSLD